MTAKLTPAQRKREATRIWQSLEGCDCPTHIDGKYVKPGDRCTPRAVRCNARLAIIHERLSALGLNLRGEPIDAEPGKEKRK